MLTAKHFLKRRQSVEETEWYSVPLKNGSLLEFEQVFDLLQQIIQKKIDKKLEEAVYTGHYYLAFSLDLMELYWMDYVERRKIRRLHGWYWFYQKVVQPLLTQAEENGFHIDIARITRNEVVFYLYIPIQQQKQFALSEEEKVNRQKAIETLAVQYSKKYPPLLSAIRAVYSTEKQKELIQKWEDET